jgi:hypothetical protein
LGSLSSPRRALFKMPPRKRARKRCSSSSEKVPFPSNRWLFQTRRNTKAASSAGPARARRKARRGRCAGRPIALLNCPSRRSPGPFPAWILREGRTEFKRWEPYGDLKSQSEFPSVDSLSAPLDMLTKHHVIRPKRLPERTGRGRPPAQVYEVNPLLQSSCKSSKS